MAYQDYMYGKYSYESRVIAQSHDLLQQAKDAGASPEVIIRMEASILPDDFIDYRHIEEVLQPMYLKRINNGTLQSEYDEHQALLDKRHQKLLELEKTLLKTKESRNKKEPLVGFKYLKIDILKNK